MKCTGAMRRLSAAVYAMYWLLAWLIVLVVTAWVSVDHTLRPQRSIVVPEPANPDAVAEQLRRFGISTSVQGRRLIIAARDAERAREWIALM